MSVTVKINNALLGWSKDALYRWQHEALRRILNKGTLSEQGVIGSDGQLLAGDQ
jgi:hypothetical protein